jgi:hypothetical protein
MGPFGSALVYVTRKLWTVTATTTVVNSTTAGVLEPNPRKINGYFVAGVCNFKCTASNNYTLAHAQIDGALGPWSAFTAGGGFPNVAGGYEALCYTESNIGPGDGIMRPFQIPTRDNAATIANTDHNRIACPVIPNFLQFSYSGTVIGASPSYSLEVWVTLVGPMMQGQA